MSDSATNLRRVFADICLGYTKSTWDKKDVFIKHLTHFDQVDIDIEREKYYNLARKKKIPTLAEKLEWLDKEKLWTKKDETELQNHKFFLDNLYKTKAKAPIKAQIKQIEDQIGDAAKKVNELSARKNKLIDKTCESFADNKMQTFYIYNSFYKDESLSKRLFTYKEYENLEEDEIIGLMDIYIDFIEQFSHSNMRKVSIAPFFTSFFYLSENVSEFFNKPLAFLTYYQANLISYGLYFKHLMQDNKIPDNIKDNPDEIENFVNQAKNMKEMVGKTAKREGGRTGIVGASQEDMAIIGGNTGNSLLKQASKMGGISNINDAVKLSGA